MRCYSRGQTRQLCMLSVHIWLCLISSSVCLASRHHERGPRLRKVSHWKAILSWISKPVQRIPDDKPFYAVWNAPSFRCRRQYGLPMDLEKFGIIGNEFELFHGEAVNLFYESRLGLYPRYLPDNKPKYGGLPQLANLTAHLEWVKMDLDWYIPNITYNGLAVIDWESWRPIFDRNWSQKYIYQAASVDLVTKQHPTWRRHRIIHEAKLQFERRARDFMEMTVTLCRELRPHAKWGFYLFPDCYNYKAGQEKCSWIVRKTNDRLSWLYQTSTALFPSIYLTDVFAPRDQIHHVRGILNEAYRVRERFTSPYMPVIPYTKYVYTNTDRFYDKQALENTIGEAMESGAAGVSLWDSSSNIQDEKQCKSLHKYLNNVLGPYVKNVLEWSANCSQTLCGGHGRCVSVRYQPKMSTSQRVVIQKGPTIERVVVLKQAKPNRPSETGTVLQAKSTTVKRTFTPRPQSNVGKTTIPRIIANSNNHLNVSAAQNPFQTSIPSASTLSLKNSPGVVLKSTRRTFIKTTRRTSTVYLNPSNKSNFISSSEGLRTDTDIVQDLPMVTKGHIKLDGLSTDMKNDSLPFAKTLVNSRTIPRMHKVSSQKSGVNMKQNVDLKAFVTSKPSIIPDINPFMPASNQLERTQRPIVNSFNDLPIEQHSRSKLTQKDVNQKLLASTIPMVINEGSVEDIEYNNTTRPNVQIKESDMKMYDNRSEVSHKRPITFTDMVDEAVNSTSQIKGPLFNQSRPTLKFNSSIDNVTPPLSYTTKDSYNRQIYQTTSRSGRRKSHKRLSTTSTNDMSNTTSASLATLKERISSADNDSSLAAGPRADNGNVPNATKTSTMNTDLPMTERGGNRLSSTASTFTSKQTVSGDRTSGLSNNEVEFDSTTFPYKTSSPVTKNLSSNPVDGVLILNTITNKTIDRGIDDNHNKYKTKELSFMQMLVRVFIILVVVFRRLFVSVSDVQSDSLVTRPNGGVKLDAIVNQYGGHYNRHALYEHISESENRLWGFKGLNRRSLQRDIGKHGDITPAHLIKKAKRSVSSSGLRSERVLPIGRKLTNFRVQTSGLSDSIQIRDKPKSINQESLTFVHPEWQPSDRVQINKSGIDPDSDDRRLPIEHSSKNHHSIPWTKTLTSDVTDETISQNYDDYVCRCYSGWTGEFCDIPM